MGRHCQTMFQNPNIAAGQTFPLSSADLRAMDLIGWDVRAVPEPGTIGLLGGGNGWDVVDEAAAGQRFTVQILSFLTLRASARQPT
jgi:hypothetical protein